MFIRYFKDKQKPIVVILTKTEWHEPPRIRHQLAKQLSKNFNVIFFQSKPLDIGKYEIETVNDSLIVIRPRLKVFLTYKLIEKLPALRLFNQVVIIGKLMNYLSNFGDSSRILINFNHDYLLVMALKSFCLKVYFCNDEFPARQKVFFLRWLYSIIERLVAKRADICFCVSTVLAEKIKKNNSNTFLLLPGHDFQPTGIKPPPKYRSRQIKTCFVGFINDRIDYALIEYMLTDKNVKLTMIGPVEGSMAADMIKKCTIEHIYFMEGKALQEEMQQHDIFLIPYKNDVTIRASNQPNKTLLYLAIGRPIVISGMPNFIEMPEGFVYRSDSKEEYLKNVRLAYEEDSDALFLDRCSYAMDRTWDAKGFEFISIIQSFMPRE